MGSGRTGEQEIGGAGVGGGSYDDDESSGGKKKDSTMGKLMEKAGGMLKRDDIAEKGQAKRSEVS